VLTIGSFIMGYIYPSYALGFFILALISLAVAIASLSHVISRMKSKKDSKDTIYGKQIQKRI